MAELLANNSYVSRKPNILSEEVMLLQNKLIQVKDKQGFLGNIWNGAKEITTLGKSASDCESMLEEFKSGKISFEEAVQYIDDFDNKQNDMKGLFSNILTGIASIAGTTVAAAGGPLGLLPLILGAPIGALAKTTINVFDRATNKVDNDEFKTKEIAKDALSGAITGITSAVSSGVSKGIKSADIGLSIKNGAKCGVMCGAGSGAGNYIIDTTLDKDRDFKLDELAQNTLTSAFVSGTVGAFVGAGLYKNAEMNGIVGTEVKKSIKDTICSDSASSSLRKGLGQLERKLLP